MCHKLNNVLESFCSIIRNFTGDNLSIIPCEENIENQWSSAVWEEHWDNHPSFLHFFQMMSSEHLTGGRLLQPLVVLLSLCLASAGPLKPLNGTECAAKGPASYILVFTGHWSPQAFPKQYPLFRPPAQWSKLIGEKLRKSWKVAGLFKNNGKSLLENDAPCDWYKQRVWGRQFSCLCLLEKWDEKNAHVWAWLLHKSW